MTSTAISAGWAVDPAPARAAGGVVLGLAGAAAAGLLASGVVGGRGAHRVRLVRERPKPGRTGGLHASAAMLATSVLADSLVEHYRGSFKNPGMYTPLVVSALGLAVAVDGSTIRRLPDRVRAGVYGLEGVVGAVGVGFHLYNLLRRPGGLNWLNLFYAAPLGAPAALSLAGVLGASAALVDDDGHTPSRLFGRSAGRLLSALTGAGLLGTAGEAGLLHFRGSFQNPFMVLPVSVPPIAALLVGKAAMERGEAPPRPLTRAWLWLTAALGFAGVGFHAFGVSRAMGGWKNWSQNVVDGPPLPAPPSFTALAIAALSALALRDDDRD